MSPLPILVLTLCRPVGQEAEELRARLEAAIAVAHPTERGEAIEALVRAGPARVDPWLEAIALPRRFPAITETELLTRAQLLNGQELEETQVQVYVPKSYDAAVPTPLLMHFHEGYGHAAGSHRTFQKLADEIGFLIVAPPDLMDVGGYGFKDQERQTALSALRWARTHFNVDPRRIVAAGISRGGHMVWDLILRYPDRFSGTAAFIGGPRFTTQDDQNNARYLENVVPLPIRSLQGAQDDPALVASLQAAFKILKRLRAREAEYYEFEDLGHDFDFDAVDWPAFFKAAEAEARPEHIVRWAVHPGERSFWLEVSELDSEVEVDFAPVALKRRLEAMDEVERRLLVFEQSAEKTARVEARITGRGRFSIKSSRAAEVRLLLDREMFQPGRPVTVSVNGNNKKMDVQEDVWVLLRDYVERLDPEFLPTAELRIRL
ncbi:MAG: alpha/beta hydrolase-fold protein [Planctomycetota bacterium]